MTVPCFGCRNRYSGCHSHCAAYTTYKEELAAKRDQVSSEVKEYWALRKYKIEKYAERYKKH